MIESATELNRAYAEDYKVSFVIEQTLPGVRVRRDTDRLMQVLTNLLSNAAKFSPAHDRVTISVTRHGANIRIAISDHGSGIPEEFQKRIFQKFAQADCSDTRSKGGTGLGLSIVKAIVEQHDGEISFHTKSNAGATFYVDLPEWKADHTHSETPEELTVPT